VQEGLAPTYRSGNAVAGVPTEDLGFWWGHDNGNTTTAAGEEVAIAQNGNPTANWYGFECPQLVPGYNCTRWGSNMSLTAVAWSPLGNYRAGGSLGFDGINSYGISAYLDGLYCSH